MKILLTTLAALSLAGVVSAADNTHTPKPTTDRDTTAPGVSIADQPTDPTNDANLDHHDYEKKKPGEPNKDAAPDKEKDKDDTAQNQRDKSGETLTPEDQSNAPEDIQITAAIRRSLVKADALSMNAKNVKIITIKGDVTLRGTVNTEDEKNQVAATAQGTQGIKNLKNELEVKKD